MSDVEVWRCKWINIMDMNVIDHETLAGSNVKAPSDPIDFQIPVNLTAFFQSSLFYFWSQPVPTLFDTPRIKFPGFDPVSFSDIVASIATFSLWRFGAVTWATDDWKQVRHHLICNE